MRQLAETIRHELWCGAVLDHQDAPELKPKPKPKPVPVQVVAPGAGAAARLGRPQQPDYIPGMEPAEHTRSGRAAGRAAAAAAAPEPAKSIPATLDCVDDHIDDVLLRTILRTSNSDLYWEHMAAADAAEAAVGVMWPAAGCCAVLSSCSPCLSPPPPSPPCKEEARGRQDGSGGLVRSEEEGGHADFMSTSPHQPAPGDVDEDLLADLMQLCCGV